MINSKYDGPNWSCGFMQRYVVTLDIACKLKKSGWRKRTSFYWFSEVNMEGKWCLGRIENEEMMRPAPMADEIFEEFPRGTVKVEYAGNNFLLIHQDVQIKSYRFVDALADLWMARARLQSILKNK